MVYYYYIIIIIINNNNNIIIDDERGRVGVLESELRSAEGQWEAKNQEN